MSVESSFNAVVRCVISFLIRKDIIIFSFESRVQVQFVFGVLDVLQHCRELHKRVQLEKEPSLTLSSFVGQGL